MAVSPRPRTFTERPSSVLPPRVPANENGGTLNPLGSMQDGVFRFASLEAEEQWVRAAYQAGVNAETWQLGDEIDDETAGLILAGLGGPAPAIYRGPDEKYRTINQRTIETAAVREHRNKHLAGKSIDQIAAAGKLPGEDERVEQWRAARVANANQTSSNPKGAGASLPNHSAFEPQEERPGLAKRFEAAARRAIVDETVFGNVYQQFASGHAVSPDVLATRPSDRFLQLGSHGILEWHRMFEPLGIAGGKRRIDFLSPQERRQWETMWEAMPAEQQAAYRGMWEEKQKSYRPWREKFERETSLPPPETIGEVAIDIAGSIAGSMASPESWIGILPRTPAQAARAAVKGSAEALATSGGGLAASHGTKSQFGAGLVSSQAKRKEALNKLLPNETTPRLTERDTYHLTGDDRGFAFVLETPRGKPESIAWEEGVRGRLKDIETHKTLSPSLLYRNSNENGLHVVKFDGYEPSDDELLVFVIDAKRRYPFYFNEGARTDTALTVARWVEALKQNPDYGIVIEFPGAVEMLLAQLALKELRVKNRIYARVRPYEW